MSLQDNKCETCLNNKLVISENGVHYNCIFSDKKAIKCMINDWCYYNELKINKNGELKVVDIKGIELKW